MFKMFGHSLISNYVNIPGEIHGSRAGGLLSVLAGLLLLAVFVEEKIPKENFRVNGEMRDEILVYESILTKFLAKMVSKCMENCVKF